MALGRLRFRMRADPPLEWRTWGNESVVFDPASGDTHLLDAVAREGLACLDEQPCDAAELASAMARRLDVPADAALELYAARLLARLDDRGVIEAIEA